MSIFMAQSTESSILNQLGLGRSTNKHSSQYILKPCIHFFRLHYLEEDETVLSRPNFMPVFTQEFFSYSLVNIFFMKMMETLLPLSFSGGASSFIMRGPSIKKYYIYSNILNFNK